MFVTAYIGPSFWLNTLTLSPGNTITYGTGFVSLGLFGAFFGGGSSLSKVLECTAQNKANSVEAMWRLAPGTLQPAQPIAANDRLSAFCARASNSVAVFR